jgi:rod shape-determining protein MreD
MRKRFIASLLLLLMAVAVQTLLPLVSGRLTIANPFLALLTVLALRGGKLSGLLWGAFLGALCDAYFLPYVGFHGTAFTLLGYLLGWIGSKVMLQGVVPLAFFGWASYIVDAGLVALLYLLLGLPLAAPFLVPVLLGSLVTGLMAAGFELAARKLFPEERP